MISRKHGTSSCHDDTASTSTVGKPTTNACGRMNDGSLGMSGVEVVCGALPRLTCPLNASSRRRVLTARAA